MGQQKKLAKIVDAVKGILGDGVKKKKLKKTEALQSFIDKMEARQQEIKADLDTGKHKKEEEKVLRRHLETLDKQIRKARIILDDLLLETPSPALDRMRTELRRMGEHAYDMVSAALPTALRGDKDDLKNLAKDDDVVDTRYDYIVAYLGKLSQQNLQARQSTQLYNYMSAANDIKNIADMVETNIAGSGRERLHHDVAVSAATEERLTALHEKVCWALHTALEALDASDLSRAEQVIAAKPAITELADETESHLALRLTAEEDDRLPLYRIETELIEYLKRIYYFAKRIAKTIMQAESAGLSEAVDEALEEDMVP